MKLKLYSSFQANILVFWLNSSIKEQGFWQAVPAELH